MELRKGAVGRAILQEKVIINVSRIPYINISFDSEELSIKISALLALFAITRLRYHLEGDDFT